jgi:multicomponent Na+:H+ antiporter subunit D
MPAEIPGLAAAPVWAIVIPLATGALAFISRPRIASRLSYGGSAATLAAVLATVSGVWSGGAVLHRVGGWGAPLGIELHADGLSVLMLLITAVVGAATTVYASGHVAASSGHGSTGPRFWPLWLMLWGGLNALYLSADLFNLYVTLEIVGLASVALVAHGGRTEAVAAALRYLLVSLVGSFAYLMGVALLYGEYGTLSLAGLAQAAVPGLATWLAAGLMIGGLALKTALYPLHFWLPPAHADAPAPVSALLSGLVVKASFYLLVRLWFDVFPMAEHVHAATLLGLLGAAAIIAGSIAAMVQKRLKLLVAYSTVAQVGYLFLLFPLAAMPAAASAAYHGAVIYMLAHACAKAAMFMSAGNVLYVLERDDIAGIAAARSALPLSMVAFALGGMSLIGLPPSGGFAAKWLLLTAALEVGAWWWAALVVIGGLLAAGYVFRVLWHMFRQAAADPANACTVRRKVNRGMELAPFLLAVVALLMGLEGGRLLALLEIGSARPWQ